jgi:serine/threonine protein kinase
MGCFAELAAPASPCPYCGFHEGQMGSEPHQLRYRTILNGKYLVGKVLGEGGFGITYLGWNLLLSQKVAIKEYYPLGFVTRDTTYSADATVKALAGAPGDYFLKGRQKFLGEAQTLAKFYELPGIVAVKDYFLENNTAYIVMSYLDGVTLKSHLEKRGGWLPVAEVLDLMKPVMESLAKVHDSGLIHRDISPDNIMIGQFGVKLLDFGAAREYGESGNKSLSIMLKPGYAPEEQYRSKGKQGPWTDVYALCATIYKCITGITPEESMDRIHEDTVKSPSQLGIALPPGQELALMKGMAVMQGQRYQSMQELYTGLFLAPQAQPQPQPQPQYIPQPQPQYAPKAVPQPQPQLTPPPAPTPQAQSTPAKQSLSSLHGVFKELSAEEDAGAVSQPAKRPAQQSWLATHKRLLAICAVIGIIALLAIGYYKGAFNRYEVGNTVIFSGRIWRVLEVNNGKALLLSERVFAQRVYHDSWGDITWAESSLRAYLNGEFLNGFSKGERARIALTQVVNDDNPTYGTPGGENTTDRIFLLSIEEAKRYFTSNTARIAYNNNGIGLWWWLRSPGSNGGSVAIVDGSGGIHADGGGYYVNNGVISVRPALWLNL